MRDSMIIYRSFYEAIQMLPDKESRANVWEAIAEYGLNGKKNTVLKKLKKYDEKMIFLLVEPNITTNITRYNNGKKGGNPNFQKGKPNPYYSQKDKHNQAITKTLPDADKDKDKDKDKDVDVDVDADEDEDNEKKIKSTNVDFIQKKIAEKKIFSEEVQKLSDFLFECIKKNNPDFLGNPRKWDDAFDKMLRIDKRNQQMVGKVIQFAQEDNFWKTVILSGKKVRDKYEQLYMQAQQKFNNVVIIS